MSGEIEEVFRAYNLLKPYVEMNIRRLFTVENIAYAVNNVRLYSQFMVGTIGGTRPPGNVLRKLQWGGEKAFVVVSQNKQIVETKCKCEIHNRAILNQESGQWQYEVCEHCIALLLWELGYEGQ